MATHQVLRQMVRDKNAVGLPSQPGSIVDVSLNLSRRSISTGGLQEARDPLEIFWRSAILTSETKN